MRQGGLYYGSTTQFTGNEREQNVKCNNMTAGEDHREVIFRLQNQPCSR